MTPLERAARALHDQTVHLRRVRDPENPTAEPVERVVAGRPWESLSEAEREERRADARIVIAAIREPSEGMVEAGTLSADREGWNGPSECWEYMIDALLEEGE